MTNILLEICEKKKVHIGIRKQKVSESTLLRESRFIEKPRKFIDKLAATKNLNKFGLIAEIKKASPSKGIIREYFQPKEIGKAYENGGATCLSVLTDEPYFRGSDKYLTDVKEVVGIPILRKDFIIETYQVIESKAIGADCILLIMAILDLGHAQELYDAALELGLDVLIEVHNTYEMEAALNLSPKFIGINNRDLKTFEVDLGISETLAKMVDDDVLIVSESGIYKNSDLKRLNMIGINCFLVGESLMRQNDIEVAVRKLLNNNQTNDSEVSK
ncbi:MAG: indole-3-glycerol-phosphate synthase [Rhodospirillaceae bacterium]|nr:indole-3-glycerol-phosphate synthase [Rhodospirillaceae bacterium]OUT79842.1 MAG: indole-3-glycerol phosphate synthase [Rhodospirillaceae bacterium TMED23]